MAKQKIDEGISSSNIFMLSWSNDEYCKFLEEKLDKGGYGKDVRVLKVDCSSTNCPGCDGYPTAEYLSYCEELIGTSVLPQFWVKGNMLVEGKSLNLL